MAATFAAEAASIIASAGSDGRGALEKLTAAFEDRLAIERAARTRAEAALVRAAALKTANEGYPCFPIGTIRSPFATKRGAPRQGALAPDTRAVLSFSNFISPDALEGLTGFSHVYVMFLFSTDEGTPRVRAASPSPEPAHAAPWARAGRLTSSKVCPPGLHGGRTGIFSTRSPHRPNSLGWSLCRLRGVHIGSRSLLLGGVDFVDGTPVVDVKPACPYDCGSCGTAMPILGGPNPGGGLAKSDAECGHAPPPSRKASMRIPEWVGGPLHAPPPLTVVWTPDAEARAREHVAAGRSRFYGLHANAGAALEDEADALIRAISQCLGLDCRSVSHGRGTGATGHTTLVAAAQHEAASALLQKSAGSSLDAPLPVAAEPPAYELVFDGLLLHLRYRQEHALLACVVESCVGAHAGGAAPAIPAGAAGVDAATRCDDVVGSEPHCVKPAASPREGSTSAP